MKITNSLILIPVALASLSLAACGQQQSSKDQTSYTAPDGTKTETTTTSDMHTDRNGNTVGTVDSKTTEDPPGMMNKTTTQETHEETK